MLCFRETGKEHTCFINLSNQNIGMSYKDSGSFITVLFNVYVRTVLMYLRMEGEEEE